MLMLVGKLGGGGGGQDRRWGRKKRKRKTRAGGRFGEVGERGDGRREGVVVLGESESQSQKWRRRRSERWECGWWKG